MAVYIPSKHWLMALIPLSVACAALAANMIIRTKEQSKIHPFHKENNQADRPLNHSTEIKHPDTNVRFMKTDTGRISGQPEVYLKAVISENERFYKNGRFNIDID